MDTNITLQTKQMIDNLKAVCANKGLGNASSEYKIITEVFLYKFLNDKFLFEAKKADKSLSGLSSAEVEENLSEMSDNDYELFLLNFEPDTAKLKKTHFISYLFNHKNEENFHILFDNTLKDIAAFNIDIFSIRTGGQSKMSLFNGISQYVIEYEKKDDFCSAIIDKIANCSFESVFEQKYDFFAQIFEYLIKDYNKDFGKYAEYYTPHSIASIIAKIMVPDGATNVTVYDPAAGSGTLVLALAHEIGEKNCTIYTQDISQKSNEFLRLNLILNNLVHSLPNVVHDDTLLRPFHKNKSGDALATFDYIVSNPPFNTDFSDIRDELASEKHKQRFFAGVPNIPEKDKGAMATYLMFVQHILFSLAPNGKAAIVIPTPFLTKGKGIDARIRKTLIDNHMLRGVVTMPSNIFSTTGTNVSVLFVENNYSNDDVVFVEASILGSKSKETERNQKTILSPHEEIKIVDAFVNRKVEDGFSVLSSYEKIKNSDYRLSPSTYFKHELKYKTLDLSETSKLLQKKANNIRLYFSEELNDILSLMFNRWFVQFEFPNKGKPYRSFGGKLEYNEKLGIEIPAGWETKNILKVCSIVDCLHIKKPEERFEDEHYYLLQLDNIVENGRIDIRSKYYISKQDYEIWTSKIEVKEGDFVVTNAGRAGAIGIIPENVTCAIGRNMTAIRPISIPSSYLRQFLFSPYMQKFVASNLDEGSFFKSLNVKSIKKIEVLVPPEEILNKYLSMTEPLFKMLINGIEPSKEVEQIKSIIESYLS